MHVDHLSYAAGPEGLLASAQFLSDALGVDSRDGGFHPRFGTRNRLIPLADGRYIEIVEVLDHPAADKAPFGQVVRARSEEGGGWMSWAVAIDDLSAYEAKLGREAAVGTRRFPDGRQLEWRQLGIKGLQADPQLPFFIRWISADELLPAALSAEGRTVSLRSLELSGDPARLTDWLGGDPDILLEGFHLEWTSRHGQPGIMSATFKTPRGLVTI
ncbi:VOC family protein [Raineyella sp. W15-4]|uniref:VOC family protein n=1 Tax=Raineyella sp. W15-4 TaxID=3081651 RepID=UPI0029549D49|nr:VOC family protein [Raineyella sp. W15-4]WOQ16286.1 VOC family protein [Raineyella sp. W15-4]